MPINQIPFLLCLLHWEVGFSSYKAANGFPNRVKIYHSTFHILPQQWHKSLMYSITLHKFLYKNERGKKHIRINHGYVLNCKNLQRAQLTRAKNLHKNINHLPNILRCILTEKRQSSNCLHTNLWSNRKTPNSGNKPQYIQNSLVVIQRENRTTKIQQSRRLLSSTV